MNMSNKNITIIILITIFYQRDGQVVAAPRRPTPPRATASVVNSAAGPIVLCGPITITYTR